MESRQIILAGIGMGSGDVITEEGGLSDRSRTNDYECAEDS